MITLLVTGAGGGVGQGVIKAARMMAAEDGVGAVRIIAADMSPLAAGLYAGDVAVLVPAAKDADYIDAIVDICTRESVDFYLPGTDVELIRCADHAEEIRARSGTVVAISPPSAVRIADDKLATAKFLEKHGLPHPKTFARDAFRPGDLPLPLVVKPRVGCRSIGVEVVRTAEQLERALARTDDVVFQELIGDDDSEYTCTIVCVAKKPSRVLALRRWLRSGDTYRATPVQDAKIEEYVRVVATELGVEGSCNFQLRLDQGSTPKLFEINARFSGTTPLCAQLGFNPVSSYILRSLGLPYEGDVRWGSMVLRHWAELVVPSADVDRLACDRRFEPRDVRRSTL